MCYSTIKSKFLLFVQNKKGDDWTSPSLAWFACWALMLQLTPRSHLAFFPFFADRLGHARARSRTHDRRAFAGRGGVAGRGRRRPAGLTEPFPAPGPNGVDGGRGGRVWRAPLPKQAERDRRQAAVLPLSLSCNILLLLVAPLSCNLQRRLPFRERRIRSASPPWRFPSRETDTDAR